ncbi:hypothetical protein LZ30DRAFT_738223 [Colletotrichum cereale]|nr:hypothetical protein LZ30DRAFT_738223 [Colletotrichum cereale]
MDLDSIGAERVLKSLGPSVVPSTGIRQPNRLGLFPRLGAAAVSCPAPLPLRALSLSRRTPCHCFPPCSLFSLCFSRAVSVLHATPTFSVLCLPRFLSWCFSGGGQALLLRAGVSMVLSIHPTPTLRDPFPSLPLRAPSSPSVPSNASPPPCPPPCSSRHRAITSSSAHWAPRNLAFSFLA